MKDILKNIIQDVKVNLLDEFDKNFERKAFFDKPWNQTNLINKRGSLMARTNTLRRSIKATIQNQSIVFHSPLPYATIHNNGGEITVTENMKRFFWAMYYKSFGAITFNVRSKAMANTAKNKKLSTEANQWKALALQKTGTKMKIEQRQFIGEHPLMVAQIKKIVGENLKDIKFNFNKK